MSATHSHLDSVCARCGASLSPRSTGRLCPACLLRATMTDDDVVPLPPVKCEGYTLLEEVGRGGMGSVWRAIHIQSGELVAIKILLGGMLATDEDRRRFIREAKITQSLHHPGIVAIRELGETDGHLFLVMDYVEGETLAKRLLRGPVPARQVAGWMRYLAEAVAHAHQRGVVHRDLKPGNILLDPDDVPHVVDFGLATIIDRPGESTRGSSALGSIPYLSPEQVAGQRELIGPRTDVHGLGAVMFHCLTGRPPFVGSTVPAIVRAVMEQDVPAPRGFNPSVPRELETICLKSLCKEPSARYQTAAELGDDLERFLRGESIRARPATRSERVWKLACRNPVIASLVSICILLAVLGTVGVGWHLQQTETLNRELKATLLHMRLQRVEDNFKSDNSIRSVAELTSLARQFPQNTVIAQRLFSALTQRQFARPALPVLTNGNSATSAKFTPDGHWIITMFGDQDTQVFDAKSGRLHAIYPGYGFYFDSLSISRDGKKVATGLRDGTAIIWELSTGKILVRVVGHRDSIQSTDLSADGRKLATGSWDGTARVWDAESGIAITPPLKHREKVRRVSFSPNGRRIATASSDHTAQVWDAQTGTPIGPPLQHLGDVLSVCFSPDGTRVLTTSRDATARIWNAATGRALGSPLAHRERIPNAQFSPDGSTVATASVDGSARLWDAFTGVPLTPSLWHRSQVHDLAFSPDGRYLLTGSYDTTARLWTRNRANLLVSLSHVLPGSAVWTLTQRAIDFSPPMKTAR